jgi:hypothetical protein
MDYQARLAARAIQRYRICLVIGGLLCFALMCLPYSLAHSSVAHQGEPKEFYPITREYGALCLLWLFFPISAISQNPTWIKTSESLLRFAVLLSGIAGLGTLIVMAFQFGEPGALIFSLLPIMLTVAAYGCQRTAIKAIAVLTVIGATFTCIPDVHNMNMSSTGAVIFIIGLLTILVGLVNEVFIPDVLVPPRLPTATIQAK